MLINGYLTGKLSNTKKTKILVAEKKITLFKCLKWKNMQKTVKMCSILRNANKIHTIFQFLKDSNIDGILVQSLIRLLWHCILLEGIFHKDYSDE